MSALESIVTTNASITVEPECMRADQLAKFLGVNRKTVYEYAMRNQIPHRRLGRRIVFSRSQVIAWLGQAAPTARGGR